MEHGRNYDQKNVRGRKNDGLIGKGTGSFVGAFEKLQKATISFVMSVCPSVRLSIRLFVHVEQLGSHCTYFLDMLYFIIFRKSVEKIQVSLKSDNKTGYFT